MCPSPQLEVGTLQLPRALQQPGKMLYNKFLVKHFSPRETKAAAEHNVWLLFIYFSFRIPVTSWPCFQFCFTSEIELLQQQSCNYNLKGETWQWFSFLYFPFLLERKLPFLRATWVPAELLQPALAVLSFLASSQLLPRHSSKTTELIPAWVRPTRRPSHLPDTQEAKQSVKSLTESRNFALFPLHSWIDQSLYSAELCSSKRDELQSCAWRHSWGGEHTCKGARLREAAVNHFLISLFRGRKKQRPEPSQELPSFYSQLWHVDSPRQITFTLQTEFPFLLIWAQSIYTLLVFCADGLESIWSPNMLKWLYGCNHIKREMKGTLHLHSPVVWLAPVSSLKKPPSWQNMDRGLTP